ncbi:MAG: tetratricopeptide repeat protein [Chloroflexi bacterium]|nr:tetratricopeptide repeat protein [Chloroflexota bacterium]
MARIRHPAVAAILVAVAFVTGVSLVAVADTAGAGLQIAYPQEGTLFPPESVAPTFLWEDKTPDVHRWDVVVRDDGGREVLRASVDAPRWRPSEDDWKQIKRRSLEHDAEVTVTGIGGANQAPSSARVHIRTSKDEVGDSLFYREVPLPFLKAVQDPSRIRWRYGTIDQEAGPPIVLQNLPVCGNCHSFADNGSTLGLDVDYGNDKGAYGILPVSKHMVLDDAKIITWDDYKREDGELTFGLLSRVSPTGRYVISTVKDRSVFVAMPDLMISQLFFPIKGILVVYDREKKTFAALPGADDPQYVQTNAAWSPDGKEIVFAKAKAYRAEHLEQKNSAIVDNKDVPEFTVDKKPFRYDLYRIPFNGGKGGTAQPIAGASNDGMSNFFPKYSPDGKWIVFCKAKSYMLLQPDSELYIVPATGGTARRLRYNTARMNSWHSWSSNSRWLVFSSKVNGPYTQLFLTHIDENGNDSPPVLLERFTSPDRAANIPEFVKLPGDAIADIREQFLSPYSWLRAGMANENTGDHKGAERAFRRGLEIAPSDSELHNALGWTLFQEGQTAEAVTEYEQALAANPANAKAHNNLALALVELGRLEEAAGHFRKSLEIEPKAEIYSDLGFTMARLGRPDEARAYYQKALELDPNCVSAHLNLAVTFVQAGAFGEAETQYRQALRGKPNAGAYNGLGYVLVRQGRTEEAVEEYRKAIDADAKFTPAYNNLAAALVEQGKLDEAEHYYRLSLDQKPSAPVYNALGAVLQRLGRPTEAAEQFDKAKALASTR